MQKSHLRKHIAEILKSLSAKEKADQSRVVFKKIIEHPRYKASRNLSVYLSTEDEVDTQAIVKHALEVDQKQCFIPLVRRSKKEIGANETRMIMVRLRSMKEYQELPVNHYGIKEPRSTGGDDCFEKASADEGSLDVVIVPGVAFARDGRRLGHGKGYYDEFFADWSRRAPKRLYTIGVSLKEQILDDAMMIVDEHDFILDEILTGESENSS